MINEESTKLHISYRRQKGKKLSDEQKRKLLNIVKEEITQKKQRKR